MIIDGGYLKNTPSSGYFYPIRDLKINPSGWSKMVIKNNKFEKVIFNTNQVVNLRQKQNPQYNIDLYLNDEIIYTQQYLYDYQIEIDTEIDIESNDKKVVEFVEGLIVDH